MSLCYAPEAWSDYVSSVEFKVMNSEGQVNTVLRYAAYVVAVGGECAARHKALVAHREELGQ
jgi:hypothetical protein